MTKLTPRSEGADARPAAPPDRKEQGLYGKFFVQRTDGRDAVGEKHHGCTYFILDLQHDPHMPAALRAYADSCEVDYPALARDLRQVANDFYPPFLEFSGITAQKPALDLERLAALAGRPAVPPSLAVKTVYGGSCGTTPYYLQPGQDEPEYDHGHWVVVWYDDLHDLAQRAEALAAPAVPPSAPPETSR